jgi:hypothetical protein
VIDVGPMSGQSNVVCWLDERGLEAKEKLVQSIFEHAKKSSSTLTEGEILEICRRHGVTIPA